MIHHAFHAFMPIVFAAHLLAAEPKDLHAAKAQYTQTTPHPSEADREHYIITLAHLRDQFAHRDATADWQAVDAEIRHHPALKNSDSKTLSKLRTGKWSSPRHDYLFRKDGTWIMLPAEPDATHGEWRIEGNHYLSSARGDLAKSAPYTILLLTPQNFIYTDGQIVFYETRTAK